MKKWTGLAIAFGLAILACAFSVMMTQGNQNVLAEAGIENTLLNQKISTLTSTPSQVTKIYSSGQLLGVVQDYSKIQSLLKEMYKERYEQDFPNTKLELGEDIVTLQEISYYSYENIDDQICQYLKEHDLFAVESNRIEFSDENDVYATIYVKNIQDFYDARDQYLLNFITPESLETIRSGNSTPELKTYGSREVNLEILEKITVVEGKASSTNILKDKQEILEYLSYGAEPDLEKKYYTVLEGDQIEGVGAKNSGLSAQQIVTINSDQLENVNQLIKPGMVLNVTYFRSPITVKVTMERVAKEIVYPEKTLYMQDPEMREGVQKTVQTEETGMRNAFYEETWINGINTGGVEVSSIITKQPVQEIVNVGTLVIPGTGTGKFRWPVDNPRISCRWGCYSGHQATDIQNAYNRYGNLYAADRGTIVEASYQSINGYYQIIDHNNGYKSYYGHMNKPAFFSVGTNVEKGDVIGQIGMTGVATGPHVHFFIMYKGVRKNPCDGFLEC